MIFFETNVSSISLDTTDMHTVSIAVFSIIAIGTFLIKAPKMKIPLKGIPMAANSHWLFGHSHILLGDFKEAFSMIAYDCANEDGLCGFWDLTNSPAISVNSAEKARMILGTSSTKPGLGCMRRHTVPLLGKTGEDGTRMEDVYFQMV